MSPVKVYIGWDGKDVDAFRVCERSMRAHSSIPLHVIPLKEWELRAHGVYWRSYRVDERGQSWDDKDGKPFSTAFSFTRFAVPILAAEESIVIFSDPDMLWRGDVAEIVQMMQDHPDKGLLCVQHEHEPIERVKMTGLMQTHYLRKNWSSLMVMRPWRCRGLTRYRINNDTGASLHALTWMSEDEIGSIPGEWNWLEGYSLPTTDPKVVHFTRGTPDMPGYESVAYADEWRAVLSEANSGLSLATSRALAGAQPFLEA